MTIKFDIDKIVNYLDKYKSDLPNLYNWNAKIDRLDELEALTKTQVEEIDKSNDYEKTLKLKRIVGQKLNDTKSSNKELFNKLCFWIIKDWGRINGKEQKTENLIRDFLEDRFDLKFDRIASSSKIGSFMFPNKMVIYDSRVAYSLNWIILSENAGQKYFPIPEGRNSKMSAFDLNVLIRLKHISNYQTNIEQLDGNKQIINNKDKQLFIDKKIAYSELNKLVKQINQKLWQGDNEKEQNLYFTEMLLFSIADREVFVDITKRWNELTKGN